MTELEEVIPKALEDKRYPSPFSLDGVRCKAFWVLSVAGDNALDYLTPKEIADALTDCLGIRTSPQAVKYALDSCKGEVARKKREGKSAYKIMNQGRQAITAAPVKGSPIGLVFTSGTQFTSKRLFHDKILSRLIPPICICDPYLGGQTLDVLSKIENCPHIKFLSQSIELGPGFESDLANFKKEFPNCQFRRYTANELHDRYIIDANGAWQVGHSLKDLGSKDTLVSPLGIDVRNAVVELFNRRWKEATPI